MTEQVDLFAGETSSAANRNYEADDIQVLEGLTAVRKRPGMYIGSTSSSGLHHLVWEIVDNAVDEHLARFCSAIDVVIHSDGSVMVRDNGRGIPTGMHKAGIPTPQVVFTMLHAGGKFGGGGYKKSGGLHGVGASVTNALSEWLEVEIFRDGKIHKQRFEYWVDDKGKEHVGEPVKGLEVIGNTNRTGTKVTFKPDARVFHGNISISYDTLSERLQEIAFLNSGLKVSVKDERSGKQELYHYEGGARQFVQFLNEDKTVLHDVVHFTGEKDDIEVEVALQYNDGYTETMASFVNAIPTRGGGTHETGFKTAYTRVMNDYARKNALLKEKDKNLEGNDLREGMMAVINIKMSEVEFVGQTKDQLGSSSARSVVDAIVSEKMQVFLEENPQVAQMLLKKSVQASRARDRSARCVRRSDPGRIGLRPTARPRWRRSAETRAKPTRQPATAMANSSRPTIRSNAFIRVGQPYRAPPAGVRHPDVCVRRTCQQSSGQIRDRQASPWGPTRLGGHARLFSVLTVTISCTGGRRDGRDDGAPAGR